MAQSKGGGNGDDVHALTAEEFNTLKQQAIDAKSNAYCKFCDIKLD